MATEVHEHVNSYVEATARACARSRDVLVVIIIVSVLIFGAFWNSRQGSWINTRVRVAVEALSLLHLRQKAATADPSLLSQLEKEMADERFDRAEEFLKERPHYNVAVATANVAKLGDMQTEHVAFLRVPFFGIVVDVNDLGMLGGFAFGVLLLWMRFALLHELSSLKTTFADATTHENKVFCYEVLAMQQVLTMPPSLGERRRTTIWSRLAKMLLLLPLVVHLTVFCYDCFTFQLGWSLSPANTVVSITVSLVFLIGIAVLTSVCFTLWTSIETLWTSTSDAIASEKPVVATRHD